MVRQVAAQSAARDGQCNIIHGGVGNSLANGLDIRHGKIDPVEYTLAGPDMTGEAGLGIGLLCCLSAGRAMPTLAWWPASC